MLSRHPIRYPQLRGEKIERLSIVPCLPKHFRSQIYGEVVTLFRVKMDKGYKVFKLVLDSNCAYYLHQHILTICLMGLGVFLNSQLSLHAQYTYTRISLTKKR